jgi:hypothetical protein
LEKHCYAEFCSEAQSAKVAGGGTEKVATPLPLFKISPNADIELDTKDITKI